MEDRRIRETDNLIAENDNSDGPSPRPGSSVHSLSVAVYFIWTLLTCCVHAIFDLNLAVHYYGSREWRKFGLTLAFWAIPHFFATASSLLKYREKYSCPQNSDSSTDSKCRFLIRLTFSFISPSATWYFMYKFIHPFHALRNLLYFCLMKAH